MHDKYFFENRVTQNENGKWADSKILEILVGTKCSIKRSCAHIISMIHHIKNIDTFSRED